MFITVQCERVQAVPTRAHTITVRYNSYPNTKFIDTQIIVAQFLNTADSALIKRYFRQVFGTLTVVYTHCRVIVVVVVPFVAHFLVHRVAHTMQL